MNSNSPRRWCALKRGLLHQHYPPLSAGATAGEVHPQHPHPHIGLTWGCLLLIEGAAAAHLPQTAQEVRDSALHVGSAYSFDHLFNMDLIKNYLFFVERGKNYVHTVPSQEIYLLLAV